MLIEGGEGATLDSVGFRRVYNAFRVNQLGCDSDGAWATDRVISGYVRG